jgi:hypothetical protein
MGAGKMLAVYLIQAAIAIWCLIVLVGLCFIIFGLLRQSRRWMLLGTMPSLLTLALLAVYLFSTSPSQLFKSEFGISPSPEVQGLRSTFQPGWDEQKTYLAFAAPSMLRDKILADGFTEVSVSEIEDIRRLAPAWWSQGVINPAHVFMKRTADNNDDTGSDKFLCLSQNSSTIFYLDCSYD